MGSSNRLKRLRKIAILFVKVILKCTAAYMVDTQVDETSWIVFVGVANEYHGNTYYSNE